jgi:hypothetical protein
LEAAFSTNRLDTKVLLKTAKFPSTFACMVDFAQSTDLSGDTLAAQSQLLKNLPLVPSS